MMIGGCIRPGGWYILKWTIIQRLNLNTQLRTSCDTILFHLLKSYLITSYYAIRFFWFFPVEFNTRRPIRSSSQVYNGSRYTFRRLNCDLRPESNLSKRSQNFKLSKKLTGWENSPWYCSFKAAILSRTIAYCGRFLITVSVTLPSTLWFLTS